APETIGMNDGCDSFWSSVSVVNCAGANMSSSGSVRAALPASVAPAMRNSRVPAGASPPQRSRTRSRGTRRCPTRGGPCRGGRVCEDVARLRERAQRDERVTARGKLCAPGARIAERGEQQRRDVDRLRQRGRPGLADRQVEADGDVEEEDREARAAVCVPRLG